MSDDFASLPELAKKYKMNESELKSIILDNKIPMAEENGEIKVKGKAFDRWMANNIKKLSSEKLEVIEKDEKKQIRLIHPMIKEGRVLFNPPDSTKVQVLTRLVDTLGTSGAVTKANVPKVLKAVIQRERLCSTAVMDGVAIPHPRSAMEKFVKEPALVVAISKKGIHFESDDGKPTNLFFLICADTIDVHLKTMARLSRLLRNPKFRHDLIMSEDYETVVDVFSKWEEEL